MRLKLTCLFALVFVLFTASCSSDGAAEPAQPAAQPPEETGQKSPVEPAEESTDRTASTEPLAAVPDGEFNERDVAGARAALDVARATWEADTPANYELQIGLETVGFTRLVTEGGVVVSEDTDPAVQDWTFPRSIEELFAEADTVIATFEADPSLVPAPADCGAHFNLRFDTELGYPNRFDQLGPCDDGVSIIAIVTPN